MYGVNLKHLSEKLSAIILSCILKLATEGSEWSGLDPRSNNLQNVFDVGLSESQSKYGL
jgi:hypothetical protein